VADDPDRPHPETLLSELKKAKRGRLKIFLGAAPGVGKTYAMLEATQRRRKEKTDLIVGILETHGRAETELLLDGLDVLPRKQIVYRDRIFYEMDIDGILKRRPRLVIVDELAHTNVPGSRHVKRYQDVQEILDSGIDVYTTLNIQHLESLNDVIARIARIRVRETVPDSVLDAADEIELIDLPPEDLIERLNQGKVYVKDQAARAITHFFSRGNLTALRELTMRAAAERVDAEMLTYMKAHAISGPWPTRERIMVCVSERPVGAKLVRVAQRSADKLRSSWIAVHVQTPNEESLKEEAKDRLQDTLALAERLGAEVVVLPGALDPAAELLNYARSRNVSRILIGQPRKRRFGRVFTRSVTQKLIEGAKSFEVLVIGAEDEKSTPEPREQPARTFDENSPREYALAIASVIGAGLVAAIGEYFIPLQSLSIIFVLPVLVSALRFGLWPSIVAGLLSFVVYRYFFTEPRFEFVITSTEDFFTLAFFLVVAMLTGRVAARSREQAEASRQSARRTAKLYDFSRRIAAAASRDDVLWAVVHHVAATLHCRSLVLLPGADGGLEIAAGYPPEDHLTDAATAASDWAWRHGKPAGWKSDTLPSSDWLFMPLRTATGPVGLLGVAFEEAESALAPERSVGPGRRRDRAHQPRYLDRGCARDDRDRAVALRPALLAVARSAHAAGFDHRLGHQPGDVRRHAVIGKPHRTAGNRAGGGRAAEPVRPEPARHDPAGLWRAEAEARLGRSQRCRRQRDRTAQTGAGALPCRDRCEARYAAALCRSHSDRAGHGQCSGQCGEIFAYRRHDRYPRLRTGGKRGDPGRRQGAGHSGERAGADLRHVLPRQGRRQPHRRHRPGPGDLPRPDGGPWRHDPCAARRFRRRHLHRADPADRRNARARSRR
jgi:two-component system sensor histidine kinase KdpD